MIKVWVLVSVMVSEGFGEKFSRCYCSDEVRSFRMLFVVDVLIMVSTPPDSVLRVRP